MVPAANAMLSLLTLASARLGAHNTHWQASRIRAVVHVASMEKTCITTLGCVNSTHTMGRAVLLAVIFHVLAYLPRFHTPGSQ